MENSTLERITQLRSRILAVSSQDTAFDSEIYFCNSHRCRLTGHCFIAALVVMDEFGGNLVRGMVPKIFGDGKESHYWNELLCGTQVDLTGSQYGGDGYHPLASGVVVPRPRRALPRYLLLKKRLLG